MSTRYASSKTGLSLFTLSHRVNDLLASTCFYLGHCLGRIERVAQWLAARWENISGPIFPLLRKKFRLPQVEIIAAVNWACAIMMMTTAGEGVANG
jgi:hypothetical protein